MTSVHEQAVEIVKNFLEASMAPDPDRAAALMAENVQITFTGKRRMAASMRSPRLMLTVTAGLRNSPANSNGWRKVTITR
jgi:ketosteroid isomerase-like protein